MPNPVGQPPKFLSDAKDKLLVAIRKGATYEIACNYAGICFNTFRKWILKAENEKVPEYVQFVKDLKEAEGVTALIWLDKIDKAMADGAWQAAAWKLERRHYKGYSNKAEVLDFNERLEQLENAKKDLTDKQKEKLHAEAKEIHPSSVKQEGQ